VCEHLFKYEEGCDTYSLRRLGRDEKACGWTPIKGFPLSSSSVNPDACCSIPLGMYLIRFPDRDLYSNTHNSVFYGSKIIGNSYIKKAKKKKEGKAITVNRPWRPIGL
jgi:hypothetical protein